MLKVYKRRLILGLIALMLLFGVVFLAALIGLRHETALFGIGIPVNLENWLVIVLSILGVIITIIEIIKVEHLDVDG